MRQVLAKNTFFRGKNESVFLLSTTKLAVSRFARSIAKESANLKTSYECTSSERTRKITTEESYSQDLIMVKRD